MANTSENSSLDSSSLIFACSSEYDFGFIFSSLTTALCFLLGFPAHLWCLWFYFGTEQKIKETQVFFLNHTVMELIYCVECGIEILNMFIFKNGILWYLIFFLFSLSWTGRPLLQTCICTEQYMAVIHPVTFLRYKGMKYRNATAVAAWLIAIAFGVYGSNAMIFTNFIYTFVFIIALAVISFCCVSVLYALKHTGPVDKHLTMQTSRNGRNQLKRNAFNTIFSALLLIVFTYFPQVSVIIFTGVNWTRVLWKFNCNMTLFLISLNDFGVIISPFLKLYKDGRF